MSSRQMPWWDERVADVAGQYLDVPVAVRAGAWFGARHLWQGYRQPYRPDLERRADVRFPGLPPGLAGRGGGHRNRAGRGPRTRDMKGTASTADVGKAIADLVATS